MLERNAAGGYRFRQSILSAAQRCYRQAHYYAQGTGQEQSSAMAYGTVVHHAVHVLERFGDLDQALATFSHYWHPENLPELCDRQIDYWLPRQSYGQLRQRGLATLRGYWELLRADESQVLGLEYSFEVPVQDSIHTLGGTVDRLAIRYWNRRPYLEIADFKGLATWTPLPTPTGWTTMGAVQVGEELLGADGRPCRVTAKSEMHQRPCSRIRFDDGSSIVCDDEHLWPTSSGGTAKVARVLSTEQLRAELVNPTTSQRWQRIWNAAPLQLPERLLPIAPYVLGAWLGDGKISSGEISKPDSDLFEHIREAGYGVSPCQPDGMTRTAYGLRTQLREIGLLGHRFVPEIYLRASAAQRLALLQGLMDTDGSWNRTRHQAVFTTINKALAEQVRELVLTLGMKARIFTVSREGYGRHVTAHDVAFTPVGCNPFRLARKAELVRLEAPVRSRRRIVRSVDPVPTVATQCVQVDAPDGLYLAGDQLVPTHNTGKRPTYLRHNLQGHAYAYASTRPEFWQGFQAIGADPAQLHRDYKDLPRRFRWIDLRDIKHVDGGWRSPRDYARLQLAIGELAALVDAGVYPMTLSGEACQYCPFRETCGGIGVAADTEGAPEPGHRKVKL